MQALDGVLAVLILAAKPARQDGDSAVAIQVRTSDALQPSSAGIIQKRGGGWIEGKADGSCHFVDVLPSGTGGMDGFKAELGFRDG